MPNNYITKNGEFITKEDLIIEIQSLLNRLKTSSDSTSLNIEMMKSLDVHSLTSIRDSLLQKCGKEIEFNLQWLHSLKDIKD
ncbi:hypothetical protein [Helicobacter cappadocius]|uniref:Uncharacterized protein n=1 Tax=Helicobacter cappadocius TaxID=3063998 RepID=A0AA90Q2Q7_9HELI|nr:MULTISPECIES: hypothetical protein [unclassified Helicobacter]MDO7252972.1 hypothetical protein [Helicobacter sp. faydin-H75]MDP2539038.1 hypothetical protein [Helicobacter sp. faydin-H76]